MSKKALFLLKNRRSLGALYLDHLGFGRLKLCTQTLCLRQGSAGFTHAIGLQSSFMSLIWTRQ